MSSSLASYARAGPSNHAQSSQRSHQQAAHQLHPQTHLVRPTTVQHTSTYPHANDVDPNMDPDDVVLFTSLAAYADALDALPLDLTRSFSDLRELDAVLGAHLSSITSRLQHLAAVCEDASVPASERLVALKDVAEEARAYKMGGEDKIRVAVNTAETIISHTEYIDSLLKRFDSVPGLAPLLNPNRPLGEAEAASLAANSAQEVLGSARKARRPAAGTSMSMTGPNASAADAKRASAVLASGNSTASVLPLPTPSKKRKPPATAAATAAAKAARLAAPASHDVDAASSSRKNGSTATASRKKSSTAMAPSASRDAPARLPRAAHTGNGGYAEVGIDDLTSGRGRASGDRRNGGHSGGSGSGDEDASGRRGSRTARTAGGAGRRGGPDDEDDASNIPGGGYPGGRRRGEDDEERFYGHSQGQHETQSGDESASRVSRNGNMDEMRVRGVRVGVEDMLDAAGPDGATTRRDHGVLGSSQDRGGEHDGPSGPPSNPDEDSGEARYCFCNNVAYGDMIGCDDEDCEREWFHLGCVGLQRVPTGTWYCSVCVERRSKDSRSSKSKKAARPVATTGLASKTKVASRR